MLGAPSQVILPSYVQEIQCTPLYEEETRLQQEGYCCVLNKSQSINGSDQSRVKSVDEVEKRLCFDGYNVKRTYWVAHAKSGTEQHRLWIKHHDVPQTVQDKNGTSFVIDIASLTDIPQVAAFEGEQFDTGEPYEEADFRELIEEKRGTIFRLTDIRNTSELAGIAYMGIGSRAHSKVELGEKDAYFHASAIAREHRGNRLAHHLMGARIQQAIKVNCERIFACVRQDNAASLAVLKNAGFEIIETRQNFMPASKKFNDNGTRLIVQKTLQ